VNEAGGLEGVIDPLLGHPPPGKRAELFVNRGEKLARRMK
jgi:hypothetical protein